MLAKLGGNSAGPAVALLIVVPSVLALFIAREGEHPLRRAFLGWPRFLVGITAALTLIAAIALVSLSPDTLCTLFALTVRALGLVLPP